MKETVKNELNTERKPVLDVEWLTSLLGREGILASTIANFEYRSGQVEMMQAVAAGLNDGLNLVVEAGTGTGKSMAYLIPAIYFSLLAKTPVVISTNTINLQQQLLTKDVPDLLKALPLPQEIEVAVLKGRSNYACLRRWNAQRLSLTGLEDGLEVIPVIGAWLARTSTGDRSELSLRGPMAQAWPMICANDDDCLGEQCSHRQQGKCFVQRARVRARGANIVVVNHALLLSDVASDNQLLPRFNHLIIDEAHHLEDVATRQFGFSVSAQEMVDYLTELNQVVVEIERRAKTPKLQPQQKQDLAKLVQKVRGLEGELEKPLAHLFQAIGSLVATLAPGDSGERTLRFIDGVRSHRVWEDVALVWENLGLVLSRMVTALGELHTMFSAVAAERVNEGPELVVRLALAAGKITQFHNRADAAIMHPDDKTIYWATAGGAPGRNPKRQEMGTPAMGLQVASGVVLHAAPLEVGPLLDEQLFSQKEATILTSATLASAGDFSYIKGRLGFTSHSDLLLGSPFDYMSAAMLYLVEDIPAPDAPGYQAQVEKALFSVGLAAHGRTLALFTSNHALRTTRNGISRALDLQNITTLAQGPDGVADQVVAAFKANPRSVLLGVASLWEGIDIIGDTLSVLVIARLPFGVPVDPVFAARSELFEDAFREYSLPQAVLKFKQGFGRLIRSKRDRGVVVVLDRRIHAKFYGRVFLDSLPACNMRRGAVDALPKAVTGWLGRSV